MGKQQEENSVGKGVIGITAVGIKDYFSMVKVYSEYYKSIDKINPESLAYFEKKFILNGKTKFIYKIAGLNLDRKSNIVLQNYLREQIIGKQKINEKANIIFEENPELLNELGINNEEYAKQLYSKYLDSFSKNPDQEQSIDRFKEFVNSINDLLTITPDTDPALKISALLSLATD